MRNLRVLFAVAVLLLTVGFGSTLVSAEDESSKCNCWYPNSNSYGVRSGDDCPKVECWVGVGALE